MSNAELPESRGERASDFQSTIRMDGDAIEIRGLHDRLAEKGAALYLALGGQEETIDSATERLRGGYELRPAAGIYAISLREQSLLVEVRNIQQDPERQLAIKSAVEQVLE